MAVTLATTARDRLSLGYNGTGTGVCGYNGQPYDATNNPGGMDGNGVAVNWINLCADMVTVGLLSATDAALTLAASSQQEAWGPSWANTSGSITYIDATHFSVDVATVDFAANRHVACDCGADGIKYGTVVSSTIGSSTTTVRVALWSGSLTNNLRSVTVQETLTVYVADFATFLSQAEVQATNAAASAASALASKTAASSSEDASAISAAQAAAAAGNNIRGYDALQAPAVRMLGTCAYLDKSYIDWYGSWTTPTVATASQISLPVTVPGVRQGDFVQVSYAGDLQGLAFRGVATDLNTVTLYLLNATGSSQTLLTATYYIRVEKLVPMR